MRDNGDPYVHDFGLSKRNTFVSLRHNHHQRCYQNKKIKKKNLTLNENFENFSDL